MAGYTQSSRRQFPTFEPLIDSDTFGKALSTKNTQYLEGAQKVQNSITYLAGLPVAREADRKYLQGVVDNLTSQANQMVGTDWSEQKLVNQTTQMANVASNDPNILNAISSASKVKHNMSLLEEDDKSTGGKNVANKFKFMNEYNSWTGSGTPGESFNSNYFPFVDIDEVDKELSKLHPDLSEEVHAEGGNTMSAWDKWSTSNEGVTSKRIKEVINSYVNNNPGVKTQIGINAQYKYKDLTPDSYINNLQEIDAKHYYINQAEIDKLNFEKIGYGKDKSGRYANRLKQVEETINNLGMENQNLYNHNYKVDYDLYSNPETREVLNNQMYTRDWTLGKIPAFSYNKHKEDVSGETPWKKKLDHDNYLLNLRTAAREDEKWQFEQQKEQKKKKEESSYYFPHPADMSKLGGSWAVYNTKVEQKEKNITQTGLNWLASKMLNSGVDAERYFDLSGNDVLVKSGTINFTDPKYGDQVVSIKDFLLGGNVQTHDKNGQPHTVFLKGKIDQFLEKTADGKYYIEQGGNPITLSTSDQPILDQIRQDKDLLTLDKAKIKTTEDKWKQALQTNPEAIKANQEVEDFYKPFPVQTGYGSTKYATEKDLREIYTDYNSLINNISLLNDPERDLTVENNLAKKYSSKYTPEEISNIVLHFQDYPEKKKAFESKKETFLNKQVEDQQLLSTPNEKLWSSVDEKQNKQLERVLVAHANVLSPEGVSAYPEVKRVIETKESDEKRPISYWFEDGMYHLKVGDAKGFGNIPVSPSDAQLMGLENLMPVDNYLQERLKKGLTLPGGYQSTGVPGKGVTFQTAIPLTVIGNQELRYHVVKTPYDYNIKFYINNPNSPEAPQEEEVSAGSLDIGEVNRILSEELSKFQSKSSGKKDKNIENNTNHNIK